MIGILALQGAYHKHAQMFERLGESVRYVRHSMDLDECSGLVIPGGESTVMRIHLERMEMIPAIKRFAESFPVFGTCAGMILMATDLEILNIEIKRNGYGPQIHSFSRMLNSHLFPSFQGIFIRAPRIQSCGGGIEVLATYDNEPVLVRKGVHMAASFHPELTEDLRIHAEYLAMTQMASMGKGERASSIPHATNTENGHANDAALPAKIRIC